jgi:hypothetical protein
VCIPNRVFRTVYSEPGAHDHFVRTDQDAVIVHISGFGLTDTRYFDPRGRIETRKVTTNAPEIKDVPDIWPALGRILITWERKVYGVGATI